MKLGPDVECNRLYSMFQYLETIAVFEEVYPGLLSF